MKVTLSFDNGPHEPVTSGVLDVLAERGVRATFFVIDEKLRDPEGLVAVRRASAEGHWIGNHTMTHSIQLGDGCDPLLPEREIGAAQELIGELSHPDRLFRPYGRGGILDRRLLSRASVAYLHEHRYTCVLWNNLPHDWDRPDDWVARCLAEARQRDWSLVVVHDLPTGAMRHLPALLDGLSRLGAEIVQEFPPDCVPVRRGMLTADLSHLLAA